MSLAQAILAKKKKAQGSKGKADVNPIMELGKAIAEDIVNEEERQKRTGEAAKGNSGGGPTPAAGDGKDPAPKDSDDAPWEDGGEGEEEVEANVEGADQIIADAVSLLYRVQTEETEYRRATGSAKGTAWSLAVALARLHRSGLVERE